MIETVLGAVATIDAGAIDAHGHVWIDGVEGADPAVTFVLSDELAIAGELEAFRAAGGAAIVDCQPPGAGRNLSRLARISAASKVAIVASTGFHLPQYYPTGAGPWALDTSDAQHLFERELVVGIEVAGSGRRTRAGVIKSAHPGTVDDRAFRSLMHAACAASDSTGAMLLIHTERGIGVEGLVTLLARDGADASRIVLCHMDKRPDPGVHQELAQAGFLLEYDTFLRPKYRPDKTVWPLLERMLELGLEYSVACGLDLADPKMWAFRGGAQGMLGLLNVRRRLEKMGVSHDATDALLRTNVLRRLAKMRVEESLS